MYGFDVAATAIDTYFEGVTRVRDFKSGGQKFRFDAPVHGPVQFSGGGNADLSTSATQFGPLTGVGLAPSEADVSIMAAARMVLTNFRVQLSAAPGGSGKVRNFRIVSDGGATALEIPLVNSAAEGAKYVAAEVAAGSLLSVQCQVENAPAAARPKWACEGFHIL